ncbi:MAG: hypothetical protein D9V45_05895 [Chloroflexi bacterium]|nr:hypothetical protein [Anaerolinea sp.]TDA66459.1 MAG: hypothetical protein D9V45_05895 [Chloroflexota bacterium]
MTTWLKLAFSKWIVHRAGFTALFVGIVLSSINYGDSILNGTVTHAQILRMVLSFFVPYCVSTFSSVSAVLDKKSMRGGRTISGG